MCHTFFEIFRFFYGITRVFHGNRYFCSVKSFKPNCYAKNLKDFNHHNVDGGIVHCRWL